MRAILTLGFIVVQAEVLLTLEEACEEKPTKDFGPLFAKVSYMYTN